MKEIEEYGEDIIDTEVSAFETVEALHQRSWLHENLHNLTQEELLALHLNDLKLLSNAKKMVQHLRKGYNFSSSKEPTGEWWWHLDKIVDGTLKVSYQIEVERND